MASKKADAIVASRGATKALPEHTRQVNRSLILRTLFRSEAKSRADLARATGLTRVSVSRIVDDLTAEGLVRESGPSPEGRVGKPSTLIALNPDAYHVVTLDLSAYAELSGAIMNLDGEVVHSTSVPTDGARGAALLTKVCALASALVKRSTVRVLGVGVGSPGVVNDDGVVREAVAFEWHDLDVAAAISAVVPVPVHVANDANAAALAARTYGQPGVDNLALVRIGQGIGSGVIVGGTLVTGDRFTAGEIGHVLVDESGEVCRCGRRGCLEVVAAVPYIRKRLAEPGAQPQEILTRAGHALGRVLTPVVAALGLEQVVLSGPLDVVGGVFLEETRAAIAREALAIITDDVEIRVAVRGDDIVLLGGTALVVAEELGIR
ncbi:ROK family transcriptional regulator [Microbacterium sp. 3J1]|uniref:ROK family transcriptional regulator n=1 Tax=Microbacterium sp. 3J1 TaxID=861269 RepID=UPI000B17CE1E|nr:ROK family transcriptional regulator [Microbacterium sp. 3J1]